MHVVIQMDVTQSTAADRLKVYINGEEQATSSFEVYTHPGENVDLAVKDAKIENAIENKIRKQ